MASKFVNYFKKKAKLILSTIGYVQVKLKHAYFRPI